MKEIREGIGKMKERPFREPELEALYQKTIKSIKESGCKIKLD